MTGGQQPGGRFAITNMPLRTLVLVAYAAFPFGRVVGIPAWAADERYDIVADADGSPKDFAPLLQTLLRDRFGMRAHSETRPVAAYGLTVVRSDGRLGPQLRPSAFQNCDDAAAVRKARESRAPDEPVACGGSVGRERILAGGMTINALANGLASLLDRPVVNRTNLTGRFDIKVEYSAPDASDQSNDPNRVNIFTALQEQLGLRLQPENVPMEVLVVDELRRPTEN